MANNGVDADKAGINVLEGQPLQEHDKQHHPKGYNPETSSCEYRDELVKELESEESEVLDPERENKKLNSDKEQTTQEKVTPKEDAAYMEAVERGDMKTATQMLDEAAKRAGFGWIGYHGTPTAGFTVFSHKYRGSNSGRGRKWFSFTNNRDAAEAYTKTNSTPTITNMVRKYNNLMERFDVTGEEYENYYVDEDAAYDVIADSLNIPYTKFDDDYYEDEEGNEVPAKAYTEAVKKAKTEAYANLLKRNLEEAIGQVNKEGFKEAASKLAKEFSAPAETRPGVYKCYLKIGKNAPSHSVTTQEEWDKLANEVGEGLDKEEGDSIIVKREGEGHLLLVKNATQIKSADPVTYDDKGNIIPLSKRFDSGDDIRGDIKGQGKEEVPSKRGNEPPTLSKKKAKEYKRLMGGKHPELDADLIIEELAKIKDKKIQADAFAWVMKGAVRLPEDLYKIEQARELATKAKKDPLAYETPQACINELLGEGHEIKARAITVEELKNNPLMSDYRNEGYGVETFRVDDSPKGQVLMREVIDTHWGKDANPWCLLARAKSEDEQDEEANDRFSEWWGNLSAEEKNRYGDTDIFSDDLDDGPDDDAAFAARDRAETYYFNNVDDAYGSKDADLRTAWHYWKDVYNSLPKRVAFKNGKLLAFMATDDHGNPYWKPKEWNELDDGKWWAEWEKAKADGKYEASMTDYMEEFHPDVVERYDNQRQQIDEQWWDRQDRPHKGIPLEDGEIIEGKFKSYAPNSKTVQDELVEVLMGVVNAEDELPQDQTLQEHDRQHHPKGYHEGDTCKYRDKIEKTTKEDKVDEIDAEKGIEGGSSKNTVITPKEDEQYEKMITGLDSLEQALKKIEQDKKVLKDNLIAQHISADEYLSEARVLDQDKKTIQKGQEKGGKKLEKMIRTAASKMMPNTKAVGRDGLPLVLFHGTISKDRFNAFREGNIFAFKQKGLAWQYTSPRRDLWVSPRITGRVMPVVMNLENPYIVDGKRRLWSNIDVDWSPTPVSTEDICKYARENGYDGVIVKQVRDNMFDNDRAAGDEYIAFSPNQVKSLGGKYERVKGYGLPGEHDELISSVGGTFDDNGKLIPLSQRFDSTKADIRYRKNGEEVQSTWDEEEKKGLTDNAKKLARFIPGVKIKLAARPFSPNGDPEDRKEIKRREHLRWVQLLSAVLSGELPKKDANGEIIEDPTHGNYLVLEHTPMILQHFGVPDKPIKVHRAVIKKILGLIPNSQGIWHRTPRHELTLWLLDLDNPIAIFDHKSEKGKIVILTRMRDRNSQDQTNDIIPLEIEAEDKYNKSIANEVLSAFGQNQSSVKEWVSDGKLRYVNKQLVETRAPWLKAYIPKYETLKKKGIATEKDFPHLKMGEFVDESLPTPNSNVREFLDDEGVVVGKYNRKTNEVTLYPGANADTIAHELCGHATWQYAEQQAKRGDDTLLKKMNEVVDDRIAKPVWDEVVANYKGESHDVQREEVWAHIIGHKGSKAIEEIRKEEQGRKWYHKVWDAAKESWKGLMSKIGWNRVVTKDIEKMSPEEFSDYMVKQMTEGRTLGKLENSKDGGERKSIANLFTGSVADYAKPSLHYVGTGEGNQVYGWGLYASNVRGVAEGYADIGKGHATFNGADDIPANATVAEIGAFVRVRDARSVSRAIERLKDVIDRNPGNEGFRNELKVLESGKIKWEKYRPHLYEQTFFTDRAPGDESHLLKWYEPVSEEQMKLLDDLGIKEHKPDDGWRNDVVGVFRSSNGDVVGIRRKGEKLTQGEFFYSAVANALGSPKAASEFLARAGIDGIKYPVGSYGKTVKDGDKAGWNYVSFRDDNIRIDKKWVDGQRIYD